MLNITAIETYMPSNKTLADTFRDFSALPRQAEAILSAWSLLEEVLETWFRQLLLDQTSLAEWQRNIIEQMIVKFCEEKCVLSATIRDLS